MPDTKDAVRTAADIEAELASIKDPDEPSGEQTADPAVAAAEADASRKGWVPKDEYTGDPSKWVDAKTFVQRGERFTKNLMREVEALKKQIEGFEGTKAAFAKFHEESIAKKDTELKEAISALRVQRSAATREGDDELAIQIEDRIDLLKEQQKEVKAIPKETAPASAPNMEDPVLNEWIEDGNDWFRDDPKLREYAVALGNELVAGGEKTRGRKFLDRVRERMVEEFPRRFKAASTPGGRQDPVGGDAGGAHGGSSGGGKTEADLPKVDRDLMRQFIKEGWTTKEKFLSSYFAR